MPNHVHAVISYLSGFKFLDDGIEIKVYGPADDLHLKHNKRQTNLRKVARLVD